jgi:hypothetical protein
MHFRIDIHSDWGAIEIGDFDIIWDNTDHIDDNRYCPFGYFFIEQWTPETIEVGTPHTVIMVGR